MSTGKGRILVVDDEMLNRTLLSTNLGESGYVVETAEDGHQALEMLNAQSFDVVLLDLMMPELDGFGVLEAMRAGDQTRAIPVIVLTAQLLTQEDMARLSLYCRLLESGA